MPSSLSVMYGEKICILRGGISAFIYSPYPDLDLDIDPDQDLDLDQDPDPDQDLDQDQDPDLDQDCQLFVVNLII